MTESAQGPATPEPAPSVGSGFRLIGLATIIAGIAGYAVTWLVPRSVGFESYVTFAVFWSFLFLLVSALSGIQQEITRASRPALAVSVTSASAGRFAGVAALVTFAIVVASAPAWVAQAFPVHGWELVWPLAVGASSYVLVAALYGSLYGVGGWGPLFLLISIDAVGRLAAIGVVLAFTPEPAPLAWAAALPFPLTLALVWPMIRHRIVGKVSIDAGYRSLTWNIARTTVAAASMGLLISGFPFLLGVAAADESPELVALLILAATLTRAPLIVVAMAFQSFLLVLFRDAGRKLWRRFLGLQSLMLAAAVVLGVLGYFLGPPVFALLFPGEPVPDGPLIAILVLSSALVGSLCITAPAVLSRSGHGFYSAGWVTAAIATIVCLALPIDLVTKTMLALIVGPISGIAIHLVFLLGPGRQVAPTA